MTERRRTVRETARAHAREQAIGALGNIAAGCPVDDSFDDIVQRAQREYRRLFPTCPSTSPWLFYDGNPLTRRIEVDKSGQPVTGRVDVYCLFCRVLLVHPAIWQWDYTDRLRPHTTMCTLRFLAGELEPGAPGTYRLPEVAP